MPNPDYGSVCYIFTSINMKLIFPSPCTSLFAPRPLCIFYVTPICCFQGRRRGAGSHYNSGECCSLEAPKGHMLIALQRLPESFYPDVASDCHGVTPQKATRVCVGVCVGVGVCMCVCGCVCVCVCVMPPSDSSGVVAPD